jgi:hypothetical protein
MVKFFTCNNFLGVYTNFCVGVSLTRSLLDQGNPSFLSGQLRQFRCAVFVITRFAGTIPNCILFESGGKTFFSFKTLEKGGGVRGASMR